MNTHRRLVRLAAACCGILHLGAAAPPDAPTHDRRDLIRQLKDRASAGPEHNILQPLAGEWRVRGAFRLAPSANPETFLASASHRWTLSGRFLRQEFHATGDLGPYEAIGFLGYDRVRKRVVGSWCESANTGIAQIDGTYNAGTRTFHFKQTQTNLQSGQRETLRALLTVHDANRHSYAIYATNPDRGGEVEMFRADYTRK